MKLDLEQRPHDKQNGFAWKSCLPFVENSRGTLIHRPRSGVTYNLWKHPHVGINFWCGMAVSTNGKNLTFLEQPPEGKIVCERCEAAAIANGLPSSDELSGRHVHIGKTKAVVTCCETKEPK